MFYAWAPRNSRPQVKSNERHRRRCNGLLAVDALTGQTDLQLKEQAKAEDIASYLAQLVVKTAEQGYSKLSIILDNCRTHKRKMRQALATLLQQQGVESKIELHFIDLPPYSPDFNLAEYLIHQIRLQILHHHPLSWTLEQIKENLAQQMCSRQLQTPEQIQKTLQHIWGLVA
jgi:allophanate hydrolase subunit 1